MESKEEFEIIWVDQPVQGGINEYSYECCTEKTTRPFRDWIKFKKSIMPKDVKGLFIYDILPTSPIKDESGGIITEPSYLIRCDWIKNKNKDDQIEDELTNLLLKNIKKESK